METVGSFPEEQQAAGSRQQAAGSIDEQAVHVPRSTLSFTRPLTLPSPTFLSPSFFHSPSLPSFPQVPHPWYASVLAVPGAYPWMQDNDGRSLNLLIPNPEAPNDPM